MKYQDINVDEVLSFEDFFTLFQPLPLLEEEKKELFSYYQIYEKFVEAEVTPKDAWIATRNIFAIKNQQIAERLKA